MNICTISGNLGADPETFFTGEGDPVSTFNLAFKSGKDKTSWIKVACFKKNAEIAQTYLHKGAKIAVIGSLQQENWKTDGGESRSTIKLLANSIEFIKVDGRDGDQNQETPF
jgi:single-strand DNA-binding protein